MAKYIDINYSRTIRYGGRFEVGVDITEKEANKLLELDGGEYNVDSDPDEVDLIEKFVDDSYACDWGDLEDVDISIIEKGGE